MESCNFRKTVHKIDHDSKSYSLSQYRLRKPLSTTDAYAPQFCRESLLSLKEYKFEQIPFNDIVRVGQISQLYEDLFCVSWILGRFCNYKCSYCWPYASTRTKDHRSYDQVISTIDEIKRQARDRGFNSFHFSFSGGEPTMHPQYLEILNHYSKDVADTNYQSVHMTTNLSRDIEWFKKYVDATKGLHRVSITASFHKEFADRKKFQERLIFLQENDVQVTVNMVMVPERFEILWEDALFFHESGINVTLKPQSDTTASRVVPGYSEDQLGRLKNGLPQMDYTKSRLENRGFKKTRPLRAKALPQPVAVVDGVSQVMQVELTDSHGKKWYVDQAERFNAFEFNKFKDWTCSSGYRSIIIREPGGQIKRSYSCHDQPLGTIDEGFKLFSELQPCITPSCVSSADSKIPKRKASSDLKLWPEKNL